MSIRKYPIAYLALFISLGGTAYAATSLPPGSVGTRALKNGAVTDAKVRRHSLRTNVFAQGVIPSGAMKVVVRSMPVPNAADTNATFQTVPCRPGENATGGGYTLDGTDASNEAVTIDVDAPSSRSNGSAATGWMISAHDKTSTSGFDHAMTAYAVCVKP
jgi:hypothetical protein